ncbi:MAG: hypothetical protein QGF00_01250 [Planctomycetota bacterium]|jgi:hypothetical protein|nr:hypothetical protein [Planctomycetota bacterium]MDP7248200.1 hypothetical protein [Planctomycetota bacterium]|tara:strand:+ start:151 stop:291 length:141 start_codon:yes stop_codon:yes gene_type:complete
MSVATVESPPIETLQEDDKLDGGDVLPGFALPIQEWFERAGKWGGH